MDQATYSETRMSLKDWVKGWIRNKKGRPYLPNFEMRNLLFLGHLTSIVNLGPASTSSRVEASMKDLDLDKERMSEGSISPRREDALLNPPDKGVLDTDQVSNENDPLAHSPESSPDTTL